MMRLKTDRQGYGMRCCCLARLVWSRLKWAGAEWGPKREPRSLTLNGGSVVAVWLSSWVSRQANQPVLRAVVLLTVRPVAQDVVDIRHYVRRHLGKDLEEKSRTEYIWWEKRTLDVWREPDIAFWSHLYGAEVLGELLGVGRSQKNRAHSLIS